MDIKVLEIRDEATFIGVAAIRMLGSNQEQVYHLLRCGYPADGSSIMLMVLYDGKATNDPYEWGSLGKGIRTLPHAHDWIIKHYDELKDGDVVDVQFLLKERPEPKTSERFL